MADNPESNEAIALRCRILRETVKPEMNQRQFVAWLDVGYQRWNNVEIGAGLSRELASLLCKKIPGLSRDWLYEGAPVGNYELLQRLSEALEKARTGDEATGG
jgi:hypothetical protein